jgi:sulfoxide reductase heme-binding subunit YedZ
MAALKNILNSKHILWLILAVPAIGMILGYISNGNAHEILHGSGEFAARFMIIAMIISPLRLLLATARLPLWLLARRRYFGVAAFGYVAIHTLFYLIDKGTASAILRELSRPDIAAGWLAFGLFVPLAITSNDASMRYLKRG